MTALTFVGEQVAPAGLPPLEQVGRALHDVEAALIASGSAMGNVVRLGVFYDAGALPDRGALLDALAAPFPASGRPALGAIPVPTATSQPAVRIDAIAADAPAERHGGGVFPDAVACGDLLFTSAVTAPEAAADVAGQSEAILRRLSEILAAAGSSLDDSCKLSIFYVGEGTAEDWEVAARVRARAFSEPGPAATGIPVAALGEPDALISMELLALRGAAADRATRAFAWPPGHWDWPIHLPWKHGNAAAGMAWVGGQVALTPDATVLEPDDLAAQARIAVANIERVLAELGFGLDDVVKVTAFVAGTPDGPASPVPLDGAGAPATTHVWLPFLAYERMVVEIEAMAMKAQRRPPPAAR